MPGPRRNIGSHFVLIPYVGEFTSMVKKAEALATKEAVITMERYAKKNTPHRTGANLRSIKSKSKGQAGIVWTTSGYGFWLEVVDRIYERGIKGYLSGALRVGVKAYPRFLKERMDAIPPFRPTFPRL